MTARTCARHVMSVAPEFHLDPDGAFETLAHVTRAAARWREVAVSHGLRHPELDMMEPAFEHAETRRARDLIEGRAARAR